MRSHYLNGLGLIFLGLLAGVPSRAAETSGLPMHLKSDVFQNGGALPTAYTCKGQNLSPPLAWSGAPLNTQSFALIVDDPDAPDPAAPKMTFVHWVLFDLPPETKDLPENIGTLPPGAHQGSNDAHVEGYYGPCPPIGRHRYMFKLYALDNKLDLAGGSTKAQLEKAMQGHILMQTLLIGTYAFEKP